MLSVAGAPAAHDSSCQGGRPPAPVAPAAEQMAPGWEKRPAARNRQRRQEQAAESREQARSGSGCVGDPAAPPLRDAAGPRLAASGCFGVCSTPGGERKTRGAEGVLGEGRVARRQLAPEKLDPPLPWPTVPPCLSFPVCPHPLHPGKPLCGVGARGISTAPVRMPSVAPGHGNQGTHRGGWGSGRWGAPHPPTMHPGTGPPGLVQGPRGAAVPRRAPIRTVAPRGCQCARSNTPPPPKHPRAGARAHGGSHTRAHGRPRPGSSAPPPPERIATTTAVPLQTPLGTHGYSRPTRGHPWARAHGHARPPPPSPNLCAASHGGVLACPRSPAASTPQPPLASPVPGSHRTPPPPPKLGVTPCASPQ